MVAGRSRPGQGNLRFPLSPDTSGKPGEAQPLTELTVVLAGWRKSTRPVAVVLIFGAELCSEDAAGCCKQTLGVKCEALRLCVAGQLGLPAGPARVNMGKLVCMNGSAMLGRAWCAAVVRPEGMAPAAGAWRGGAGSTTVAVMPACLTWAAPRFPDS